jgi:hypothetical protein
MRRCVVSASFLAGLALILFASAPLAVHAQSLAAGGAIEGTITDESGAVLPGVNVTIRNTGTGIVRETHTDPKGVYRAPLLPVGTYEVTGALSGFATTKRPNLVLNIGQVLSADLTSRWRRREEVTVTRRRAILEPS